MKAVHDVSIDEELNTTTDLAIPGSSKFRESESSSSIQTLITNPPQPLEQKHQTRAALGCSLCGVTLNSVHDLKKHKTEVHQNEILCSRCNYVAKSRKDLIRHSDVMHIDKKKFKCEPCGKLYYHERDLKLHVQSFHVPFNQGELSTTTASAMAGSAVAGSAIAGSAIASSSNASQTVAGTLKAKFKCSNKDCSFSTNKLCGLRKHSVTHEPGRPIKCSLCHYTTSSLAVLRKHLATVHSEDRNHKCTQCGKCYYGRRALADHFSRVHRRNCRLCGMYFSSLGQLRHHERTHQPDEPSA